MRILVTGGAGFIGSNFIHHMLRTYPDYTILNLDKLTYAGNLENLRDVENDPRYTFIRGDIAEPGDVEDAFETAVAKAGGQPTHIVNFAAESHVDRSIEDSSAFVRTNVGGTQVLLEAARRHGITLFLQVSTDEVYGSLGPTGYFTEDSPLAPNSPYSASKAAADLLVRAYAHTYGLPAVITRCSNNYGPFQFPEKLIPLMISNAIEGRDLPVYGDGLNVRDWIYVEDHCRAIDAALHRGRPGEIYNIGGRCEKTNLEVVRSILRALDRAETMIRLVTDRLGHDRRYAIDPSKAERELGWRPTVSWGDGLERNISWYKANESWWRRIKSGEYRE